jgi:hypothetical protein
LDIHDAPSCAKGHEHFLQTLRCTVKTFLQLRRFAPVVVVANVAMSVRRTPSFRAEYRKASANAGRCPLSASWCKANLHMNLPFLGMSYALADLVFQRAKGGTLLPSAVVLCGHRAPEPILERMLCMRCRQCHRVGRRVSEEIPASERVAAARTFLSDET